MLKYIVEQYFTGKLNDADSKRHTKHSCDYHVPVVLQNDSVRLRERAHFSAVIIQSVSLDSVLL